MTGLARAAVAAAVVLAVGQVGGPTRAAVLAPNASSSIIARAALASSGVAVSADDPVAWQVALSLDSLASDGLLNPSVTELANQIAQSDSSPELMDALNSAMTDSLATADIVWNDERAAWQAAFEAVKADFLKCRTEGQSSAANCAVGLGAKLQVAHAAAIDALYQSKLAAVSSLPVEEQAAATAKVEKWYAVHKTAGTKLAANAAKRAARIAAKTAGSTDTTSESEEDEDAPDSTSTAKAKNKKSNSGKSKGEGGASAKPSAEDSDKPKASAKPKESAEPVESEKPEEGDDD